MWAAATAISCFVLAGRAPSAKTSWLNAWKASRMRGARSRRLRARSSDAGGYIDSDMLFSPSALLNFQRRDRKSTRLNSSHGYISYAVFCLKKKNEDVLSHHEPGPDLRREPDALRLAARERRR